MTQAIDIIRDALEQIRVADANAAIGDNDAATGLRALNAMMRSWEAGGLSLGWSDVVRTQDDMPTPPETDEAVGANLAVRLAAKYGVQVSATTVALATEGVSLIRAMIANNDYSRCSYGDLPRGTGQRSGAGWRQGFVR